MNLLVASENDSDRIKNFYGDTVESEYLSYRNHRTGSFFEPYKKYSSDFVTYILVDDEETVHAVATLLFREGYLNGEKQIIGYATDLKVSSNRKAILSWSNHFLPVLLQEREKRKCKYVFTVVTHAHKQAYNAFIRPRSPKRKLPRYHLFRRFQAVSLHGLLPFVREPLESIETGHAIEQDKEALTSYILKQTKKLPYHISENQEEFWSEPNQLFGQNLSDFIIAQDTKKNIVGCTLPWSGSNHQDVLIDQFEGQGHSLYNGLKFLSYLGMAKALPSAGSKLNYKFLTHFYFDNPDIFTALLRKAWESCDKNEFLSFCHFKDNFRTRLPKSYIKSKLSCGLYCLLAPEDSIPDFLKLAQIGEPPEFNPFLL